MSMVDKYESLQDKLGFDIRELSEYKFAQLQKNEVIMNKTYKDAEIVSDDLLDIKEKLKLAGWGSYEILGYINGNNNYKVKLKDNSNFVTIITMEKEGRIIHILQDKTKGVK